MTLIARLVVEDLAALPAAAAVDNGNTTGEKGNASKVLNRIRPHWLGLLAVLAAFVAVLAAPTPATAAADATATIAAPATAAVAAPATAANWTSDWFQSPTGNIRCRYFFGSNPLIACMTLNDGAMAGVRLRGSAFTQYGQGKRAFPPGPTLRYRSTWRSPGEFKCRSSRNGMDCQSMFSGHGFFISRDTWYSY